MGGSRCRMRSPGVSRSTGKNRSASCFCTHGPAGTDVAAASARTQQCLKRAETGRSALCSQGRRAACLKGSTVVERSVCRRNPACGQVLGWDGANTALLLQLQARRLGTVPLPPCKVAFGGLGRQQAVWVPGHRGRHFWCQAWPLRRRSSCHQRPALPCNGGEGRAVSGEQGWRIGGGRVLCCCNRPSKRIPGSRWPSNGAGRAIVATPALRRATCCVFDCLRCRFTIAHTLGAAGSWVGLQPPCDSRKSGLHRCWRLYDRCMTSDLWQ